MRTLVFCLFALLLTFVSATNKSCLEADSRLLKYIDWQMKTSKCNQNNQPSKCVCKSKERRPIAFMARLSEHQKDLKKGEVLVYQKIITNEGVAYNHSTGVFTCPENGVYSFTWTVLTPPRSMFNSVLVVDGKEIAYNYNDASRISNYKAATHSAVIKLKRGNKVWIMEYGGHGKFANATWSSFSGFRL